MIDGEVVALDESGRPSFNSLQNQGSPNIPIHYYVFDLLMLAGGDETIEPLEDDRLLYTGWTATGSHRRRGRS